MKRKTCYFSVRDRGRIFRQEFDIPPWRGPGQSSVLHPSPLRSIVGPLLEMGFTLRHIFSAIQATGNSCEVNAHNINVLATWMIEHGYVEDSPGVRSACRSNFSGVEELAVSNT